MSTECTFHLTRLFKFSNSFMPINWEKIWAHVVREFQCDPESIHGPSHWRRVERNGLYLATRSGAVEDVVRLFAVFHDSRREHDGWENVHGQLAATYAESLRGTLFDISDEQFELLRFACAWHTEGDLSDQPTVATCWDADRFDLVRVGRKPNAKFMSTEFGREIAIKGSIDSFIQKSGWKQPMPGNG